MEAEFDVCEARERARQKSQTFTSSLSHSHTHTGLEAELEVSEAMERARPKSQTFTRQSELSNMLDGCSTHTHTTHRHRQTQHALSHCQCLFKGIRDTGSERGRSRGAAGPTLPRCQFIFYLFRVPLRRQTLPRCGGRRYIVFFSQ